MQRVCEKVRFWHDLTFPFEVWVDAVTFWQDISLCDSRIHEELEVFLFLSPFSCKPLQGSNIHHFALFPPALNDKPQQMAVRDIQADFQLQIHCSRGNPRPESCFQHAEGSKGQHRASLPWRSHSSLQDTCRCAQWQGPSAGHILYT